jgi:putative hydrolase of the HAD superfamily
MAHPRSGCTAPPQGGAAGGPAEPVPWRPLGPDTVWLFDLDDTLHDATAASMGEIRQAMGEYIVRELGISESESNALRTRYWLRYGATLLGLVRHHGVQAAHFLHHTHLLPGLEARVRGHAADLAALQRLPGRKYILTNAPADYAGRVLRALGMARAFDGVFSIEDMRLFGDLRPKPDARMLRALAARLGVAPGRCVLVEDTLVHQKSARSVGMGTVWMQRYMRGGAAPGAPGRARLHRKPAYVDRRVRRLRDLFQHTT